MGVGATRSQPQPDIDEDWVIIQSSDIPSPSAIRKAPEPAPSAEPTSIMSTKTETAAASTTPAGT